MPVAATAPALGRGRAGNFGVEVGCWSCVLPLVVACGIGVGLWPYGCLPLYHPCRPLQPRLCHGEGSQVEVMAARAWSSTVTTCQALGRQPCLAKVGADGSPHSSQLCMAHGTVLGLVGLALGNACTSARLHI